MKERILVVDDEIDICLLLSRFLGKNGYEVAEAYSAKSAIDLIKQQSFDLVICDFRLPDMDGTESIKAIKEVQSDIKIIIITGYSDVKTAVQCIKLGAFEYVTKPIYPEEILITVKKALKSSAVKTTPSKSTAEKQMTESADTAKYVIGESAPAKRLEQLIGILAPTDLSVVIQGESGTGKEFVANAIHRKSNRKDQPFVAIDCGALPKELAGSELFGHIKGSFTGALNDKVGHFELANGGTLFLDEIGNLSYENQIKLLRVLQERKVKRIGDTKDIDIDVRVLVASNEDLMEASKKGTFREDLFYRLNEFVVEVPPLRNRRTDILLFANHFLQRANVELNKSIKGFDELASRQLMAYNWPGNLRELGNVIKRAVLLCQTDWVDPSSFPIEIAMIVSNGQELEDEVLDLKKVVERAERKAILKALEQSAYNKTKAAKLLNIDRKTLYNKMESYQIDLKNQS